MRITLWVLAALAALAAAYCVNQAVHYTWAATGALASDPDAQGKWAGRFFGFAFLLLSASVGLVLLALRAGKDRRPR